VSLDRPELVRVRLGQFGSALLEVNMPRHRPNAIVNHLLLLALLAGGLNSCLVNPVPTPESNGGLVDKAADDDAQGGVAGGKDAVQNSSTDAAAVPSNDAAADNVGLGDAATVDVAEDASPSDLGHL
jgi:hypothetical protein